MSRRKPTQSQPVSQLEEQSKQMPGILPIKGKYFSCREGYDADKDYDLLMMMTAVLI
jgi:hypothetical protein